ncbi:MAG: D-aminoacylase [Gemmatimonadetes bacterium]|nr:D-aminoacylase [Gemmatimonadota bacterium]
MRHRFALFASLLPFAAGGCARPDALPYDVLITDARVVDGTGGPWYRADVAVQGGRIAAIGRLQARPARVRINALSSVVTPGFVDMMGGSSLPLYRDPVSGHSKITQGITTMLVGEGGSLAPQNERTIAAAAPGMDSVITWRTFGEYFRLLEAKGIALNVVHNVGAAQVRLAVIGEEGREPTPEELDAMRALVRQAMEDGAVGLSTALIYPPGTYATTEELIELAKVVAQYGGAYFSHMRNESAQLLESIAEVARIAQAAGIPGHIYHLKAAGQENWPLMPRALDLIARVRTQGVDVTADIYPYIRNGIGLGSFLHPRHYAAGEDAFLATLSDPAVRARLRTEVETTSDWENWYRHVGRNWDNVLITAARAEEDRPLVGRSVREAARALGRSEWDAFFDLVQRGGVSVAPQSMNEEQKQQAMRAPFVMIDTDAAPVNPAEVASAHPRAFGTFPRILAKYVREEGVLSLEAAVQRMTALPANRLGLRDRGRIAEGLAADLVVFTPETVRDVATFTDPLRYSEGIDYVMVNGRLVVDAGRVTGAMPGLVLRHRR